MMRQIVKAFGQNELIFLSEIHYEDYSNMETVALLNLQKQRYCIDWRDRYWKIERFSDQTLLTPERWQGGKPTPTEFNKEIVRKKIKGDEILSPKLSEK